MSSKMGLRKAVSVGNYKFTGKRLGKGNFALVEEAEHTTLNVKVAVKIMDVSEIKENYVIKNLYREAKIMSQLSHPCIAALFQTMQHGNVYYLVTELVSGGDLCKYIKAQRSGKLDEQCTKMLARQLISAISHMHNLGIVHRDLKMENIMLCPTNDRIKIVDFGLSNAFSGNELLQTHCGSPEYAAPELFVEGKHYGPEVDLWSLGVILYGMVVGQLPFVSSTRDGGPVSQHRRRLLEQINKGLSTPHRKALALFTSDFKCLMGKLLVADSSKRINILDLVYHPWVTEKGRLLIQTNPMPSLNSQAKISLVKEVASIINANWEDAQMALKSERQGNVAGLYNILSHRRMSEAIARNGDPVVMRANNNHTLGSLNARTESAKQTKSKSTPHKRQLLIKSAPPQQQQQQQQQRRQLKTPTTSSGSTETKFTELRSPSKECPKCACGDGYLKRLLATRKTIKSGKADEGLSMNVTYVDKLNRANIASKRNGYSDARGGGTGGGKCLRLSRVVSRKVSDDSVLYDKDNNDKKLLVPDIIANLTRSSAAAGDAGEAVAKTPSNDSHHYPIINDLMDFGCLSSSHNTRSNKSTRQDLIIRNTIPVRKSARTASATTKEKQPLNPVSIQTRAMSSGPRHTADRAAKRRSMLVPASPIVKQPPPLTTPQAPRPTSQLRKSAHVNPAATMSRSRDTNTTKQNLENAINAIEERHVKKPRTYLSNEPIARSIAGYMTRNISRKTEPAIMKR